MDYMCKKYRESEDLHTIRDEAKIIFSLFCNDPTKHDESQKEMSAKRALAINQA